MAVRACVQRLRVLSGSACEHRCSFAKGIQTFTHHVCICKPGLEPINEQRVSPANGGGIPPDMLQALSQLGASHLVGAGASVVSLSGGCALPLCLKRHLQRALAAGGKLVWR